MNPDSNPPSRSISVRRGQSVALRAANSLVTRGLQDIAQLGGPFQGNEPRKGVNPDEVVDVDAAIKRGVLSGEARDTLFPDVTPISLGVETFGGIMTKLVERNTRIPTERKHVFSTTDDNLTAITVKVYLGERPMAADNHLLGIFNLEGIPPAPSGTPQIEVRFVIDVNGILNVAAKDLGTGNAQTVRIELSSGISENEIERMLRDADSHADEDSRKRAAAVVPLSTSTGTIRLPSW